MNYYVTIHVNGERITKCFDNALDAIKWGKNQRDYYWNTDCTHVYITYNN